MWLEHGYEDFGNQISPPSEGVSITRQNTALSMSGFSIISSFHESLNTHKRAGKEFMKAVTYDDVKSALCLHVKIACHRNTCEDTVVHQSIASLTFLPMIICIGHTCQSMVNYGSR